MGPLQGIRIIDMTSVLMGPFATQMLGDWGADVIKVESPDGDVVRQIGPQRNAGMGAIFLNANRSKRSIALDLKKPEGLEALKRMLQTADVLIYNVRPQAMDRLGLGYDVVQNINPRLVYAGLFGYGQDGPYAARPAYDDLIQGGATLPHLMTRSGDGTPRYVPTAMADRIVGLTAASAILATLVARGQSGMGQRVDIPMFETMVGFVLGDHLGGLTFDPPLDEGGYARQLSRERRPFQTSDGHVCALVYNDRQWESFQEALAPEEPLRQDARFKTFKGRQANVDVLGAHLSRIFKSRTTAQWIELLDQLDVPVMPMHDLQSVLQDPHLVATNFFSLVQHPTEGSIREMRSPPRWSDTPTTPFRPAPRLGENTDEILRESGFNTTEIQTLYAANAVIASS